MLFTKTQTTKPKAPTVNSFTVAAVPRPATTATVGRTEVDIARERDALVIRIALQGETTSTATVPAIAGGVVASLTDGPAAVGYRQAAGQKSAAARERVEKAHARDELEQHQAESRACQPGVDLMMYTDRARRIAGLDAEIVAIDGLMPSIDLFVESARKTLAAAVADATPVEIRNRVQQAERDRDDATRDLLATPLAKGEAVVGRLAAALADLATLSKRSVEFHESMMSGGTLRPLDHNVRVEALRVLTGATN